MNYIVLDLEWNQANGIREQEVAAIPFEIIEIGAVRMNQGGVRTGEFSELIKPTVYHEMHYATGKLIHLRMKELRKGRPFLETAESFFEWCGEEEYRFCTWGGSDLTELQRNMEYYYMEPLSDGPIAYWDIQKLFSLAFEDGKSRKSLEYAVDFLKLEKDIPFHRALSDAHYTGRILERILAEKPEVLEKLSYDAYHPPKDRKSEIRVQFDTYAKYISREFDSKEEAFADREVASSKCYLCHRNLRKKIRWFAPNGRHYFCLAYCESHGYLKGKIRIRKSADDKIFVVKTTKLISPEEAEQLKERRKHASELHRQHSLKKKDGVKRTDRVRRKPVKKARK